MNFKKLRAEDERSKKDRKQKALSAVVRTTSSSSEDLCFAAIQEEPTQDWYLDSGATVHMTGSKDQLEQIHRASAKNVKFADGQVLQSRAKGVVTLVSRDGNDRPTGVKLGDVLFVPGLSANVVSVSAITKKGFDVVFKRDQCCVMKNDKVLLIAQKVGELYKLNH